VGKTQHHHRDRLQQPPPLAGALPRERSPRGALPPEMEGRGKRERRKPLLITACLPACLEI